MRKLKGTVTTIFALSSPPGRAGVAVIRVSGPEAIRVAERLAERTFEPRRATRVLLKDPVDGGVIDDGLVIVFLGPRSFTGEDVAEFHVHGGRALVRRLLSVLGQQPGCIPADAGAFTRRAFEAGKLDLTRVEAIADVIDAETEQQHRQAVAQLDGRLFRAAEGWRERLIEARAFMEAALDFSDEADVAASAVNDAMTRSQSVATEIEQELGDARRGEILRDGFQVVLAGQPNAGKSSLLNVLAGRDAAIVSAEPGTTRDIVEVRLDLAGYPVLVRDTAGIRAEARAIEAEGIRRAEAAMADAQLVMWLSPTDAPCVPPAHVQELAGRRLRTIATKADLAASGSEAAVAQSAGSAVTVEVDGIRDGVAVSAATGRGLSSLVDGIAAEARTFFEAGTAPLITAARHREALQACADAIRRSCAAQSDWPEVKAEELRVASDSLGRLVGHVHVEDVLDRLFAGFCIGK